MRRRDVILGAAALPLATYLARSPALAQFAPGEGAAFTSGQVRQMAHKLAQAPFKAPDDDLPAELKDLSYDRYRDLRYVPDRAIWRGQGLPFEMQLFHRGFLFVRKVPIFEVAEGRARALVYSPDLYTFGKVPPPADNTDIGFSGFRLHAPLNRPDYYDEVAAFQGASYFRAVSKGQIYGLSARGLAIKTGDPGGEEFPFFKSFWVERPRAGTNTVVVHALLDSPSAAAAYRFTIRPGDPTVFDVELTLYPRADISQLGLAPITSMFLFSPNGRREVDDYRPAVHDSDGLAIWNGRGERVWRPLANPRDLQISEFGDVNPRGFGLMQRQRAFHAYEDLEARYERRPGLWIEPIGNWGEGSIHLIEIPTREEIHDNIAAFWRPREPWKRGGEYGATYRLHWSNDVPAIGELGRVTRTASGGAGTERRLFVIELEGAVLKDLPIENVRVDISASEGGIENPVARPNPETGGWRVSFELRPEKAPLVELRMVLMRGDQPLSETWLYRWTA